MKPIILVVDDSDIQRQLIGGLLKSESDYDIRFAWDGQDACDYLGKSPADMILTDLLMPGIDGLALIEQLRLKHPDIPVALVTAHGNEEIAEDALRRGAVNYVPKAELAERLLPTVNLIIHRVRFDQENSRFAKRLNGAQLAETIASDPCQVEPLVDRVHEALIAASAGDRIDRVGTCIALTEALSNAVLHGNLEITGAELAAAREAVGDNESLERIVNEKLSIPTLSSRQVSLRAEISAERVVLTIRDERASHSTDKDIAVETNDFLQRGHARGLILMKSLTDELVFNPADNEVTLVANLI